MLRKWGEWSRKLNVVHCSRSKITNFIRSRLRCALMFTSFHTREAHSKSSYSWEYAFSIRLENEVMGAENWVFFCYSRSKTANFLRSRLRRSQVFIPFYRQDARSKSARSSEHAFHVPWEIEMIWAENWVFFMTIDQNRSNSLRSQLQHSRTFTFFRMQEVLS